MSNQMLLKWALIAAGLCVAAILFVAVARFMRWLGMALWAQSLELIETVTMGLIKVACVVAGAIQRAALGLLGMIWSLCASFAMAISLPVKIRANRLSTAIRENAKLRQLYWKYGHTEFASFAEFRRHLKGETPHEKRKDEPPPAPKADNYGDAQAVLGFSGNEPLTQTDLKVRFQKMIRLVHSDTGFPNTVFAQQLTHAVSVIKKVKKWK